MRRWQWAGLVVGSCILGAVGVGAGEQGHAPAASAEFERIKGLAGRWEGTAQHGEGAGEPATVEYKLTSGGHAVVETLFPGTPHEMVSVYHDRRGKLSMTHYCMLGNQPELELTQGDAQQLQLSLSEGGGIDAAHELHMHALTLAWPDDQHLIQTWTSYEGGQPQERTTIRLTRSQ